MVATLSADVLKITLRGGNPLLLLPPAPSVATDPVTIAATVSSDELVGSSSLVEGAAQELAGGAETSELASSAGAWCGAASAGFVIEATAGSGPTGGVVTPGPASMVGAACQAKRANTCRSAANKDKNGLSKNKGYPSAYASCSRGVAGTAGRRGHSLGCLGRPHRVGASKGCAHCGFTK